MGGSLGASWELGTQNCALGASASKGEGAPGVVDQGVLEVALGEQFELASSALAMVVGEGPVVGAHAAAWVAGWGAAARQDIVAASSLWPPAGGAIGLRSGR